MLYALVPLFLFSTYLYGWRVPALTLVVFALGIITEYIFARRKNKPVSEAVLVTCSLYTLSLPPMVPLWIAGIGIIFAVVFAKEVYGGFGRNIFNPAIAGRLFIYITFPNVMTRAWAVPGNFGMIDTITSATPLEFLKAGQDSDLFTLLYGNRTGSIGESATILIVLAAIYLIWTKTANWRIILATLGSALLTVVVINFFDPSKDINLLHYMLSGSILFVAVFIATDPITAPKKVKSLIVYGVIIGSISMVVRTYSLFPEGTSFGVLMANTFASLLDIIFTKKKVTA